MPHSDKGKKYFVGAVYWVKEKWGNSLHGDGHNPDGSENVHDCPAYYADKRYRCGKVVNRGFAVWRDPDTMPKEYSRFAVIVVSVLRGAGVEICKLEER